MSLENIKQCAMCRKPFISQGIKLCSACLEQIELDFAKIKEYLYDHSGRLTVKELAKETEVPEKTILHLMREGRIEIGKTDGLGALLCEMCKRPIASGTLCDDCRLSLAKSLDSAAPQVPQAPKAPEKKSPPGSIRGRMHGGKDD